MMTGIPVISDPRSWRLASTYSAAPMQAPTATTTAPAEYLSGAACPDGRRRALRASQHCATPPPHPRSLATGTGEQQELAGDAMLVTLVSSVPDGG
jgi:hypothetical protein